MSRLLDRWFVAPRREELDQALLAAVKTVNGHRRSRVVPWPPADHLDYRRAYERDAEGWYQWGRHGEASRHDTSEVVWTAWWWRTPRSAVPMRHCPGRPGRQREEAPKSGP